MSADSDHELLFFDTFAQTDVNEGPNLGLVQFPNPIVIKEIRVVPLGVRVEADFPGGSRLGATNPSAFDLQFFINDLTRRNTCTFKDIGTLEYKQNLLTNFVPKEQIPTDGLILRGMYSTLTLAVFGYIADISSIIAQDSSDSVSDVLTQSESNDNIDEPLKETIDNLPIDEQKMSLILQTLSQTSEECARKRQSPTVKQRTETKESLATSPIIDEIKKKDKPPERSSRSNYRPKDRIQSRRSPLLVPKGRSRSRSKSTTRSETPSSLKRYRYGYKSPHEMSPKRHRSPRRKSRSPTPRSPHFKALSRSPLSPQSQPISPLRASIPKSPIKDIEVNSSIEPLVSEPKANADNLAFDDSELFEPLSPENSLSDIAEKISDDENLDQILAEDEHSEERSKDDLEEISSEEEYEDDGNVDSDLIDYNDFDINAYMDFNPFQCEFTSLQVLKDPSLTNYELSSTDTSSDFDSVPKLKQLIESLNDQVNDKWVEGIEQISAELSKTLLNDETIVKSLFKFVVDGIDFDLAMKQTNTAYKVRHLKAGIKLLIALSQTSDDIVRRLLNHNVIHTLLELYSRPYMTIPVRLLIIRGIDAICDFACAVEQLIDRKYEWTSSEGKCEELTCYQRLLDILMEKPSTRIVVSLTNLLNKIHLFEVLKFLSKAFEENREKPTEESVILSLNEILMIYKNANHFLSQPLRSLPASKQFDVKSSPFDSYKAIYKYFKKYNFIECLTNIISGKTISSADTLDSVLDLLATISNFGHGLRFLLSSESIESTTNLYKVLIQQSEDSETQIQSVALKLIYRLQVLQLIDLIFSFHSNNDKTKTNKENFDDPDLVSTLHGLYTMLFTGIGKDAVVQVLSSENNFDSILPFICGTSDSKKEVVFPKSVSSGCALEICLITLQFIDNNLMSFLDSYGQILLKVCETESTPKLQNLLNWLSPIKNVSYNVFNENTFKSLMSIIKKHYDSSRESADNTPFTPSPELITTVRILQNLCFPSDMASDSESQLKYKYALIQIFSMDGLSNLVFLLNKLSETYLKPSHQTVALIGNQGSLVVNFIKPCVLIIKSLLSYLISSRTTEFKDVSPIPVLLKIYSVLSLVPSTASQILNASVAQQIQYEISETLLIYTEVYINGSESDETITKSVWTKMVDHLISYTLSSPLAFIHGLSLLSDVLPQPLPLVVKQPMLTHEVIKTVNFRKLWSLHLHVLSERIDSLISSLITSNIQPIQLLLKRVCAQLCDLSTPTVTTVSKSVFESLLSSLDSFTYAIEDKNVVMCPTVRILNFILDFSINMPFRLGFLSMLSNGIKKDDKNANILTRLQNVLNKSTQIESQESALNFIVQPCNLSEAPFDANDSIKTETTTNETIIPTIETLNNYFTNRSVYVLEDEQMDRDWLTSTSEESEHLPDISDSVKIDLMEMSSKYFSDFDIKTSLEKLWSEPLNEIQVKENGIIGGLDKNIPLINRLPIRDTNKRMISGRGRGRAFPRTNDPFRSRPPNTSRPPSMHVDDFVALERNDPNSKRTSKEFVRPNRGGSSLRSFGSNQRSSNAGNYRPNTSARNANDRYNSRDIHSLSTNRVNRSDPNFPLRWNRIGDRNYDFRNSQYSRTFNR